MTLRRSLFILILAALPWLSGCAEPHCVVTPNLNELFGGGLPICLGESFSQAIERFPDARRGDSSLNIFTVSGDTVYSYAPGGGLDLGLLYLGGRVQRACLEGGDAAGARSIAERIRSRVGGRWTVMSAPDFDEWQNDSGVSVSARSERPFSVCIDVRLSGARGQRDVN